MVQLRNIKKYFQSEWGQVAAVDDVTLDFPPGQLVTLLGPSGCGKTTTLRCIAGLEKPHEGTIQIGNETVFSSAQGIALPAYRRRIGMVFQSYAIWPHMTVFANVAFPLEGTGLSKSDIRKRVERTLDLVGLLHLANRPAPQLSGGQQQRVALARALVAEPEVLLLDEPLCNLDAKLRVSMRGEIRALQQRLGITTIYVTHDQQEALAISDRVVVMSGGRVVEEGAPGELYERPKMRFTAEFVGTANMLPIAGAPARGDAGQWQANCPFGALRIAADNVAAMGGNGSLLMIRPEHLHISAERVDAMNSWAAQVVSATFLGGFTECVLTVGEHRLSAQIHGMAALAAGQNVYLRLPPEKCVIVRDDAPASSPASVESPPVAVAQVA
ncbi:MAG TPA: ABC transporter ATP-binding protein [Alphaproteobacteria bacterium]|nr:ABC transporter ATP-binding protein [Alphaproteobacteria bacterium]